MGMKLVYLILALAVVCGGFLYVSFSTYFFLADPQSASSPTPDAGTLSCDEIAKQMCEICLERGVAEERTRVANAQALVLQDQIAHLEAELVARDAGFTHYPPHPHTPETPP